MTDHPEKEKEKALVPSKSFHDEEGDDDDDEDEDYNPENDQGHLSGGDSGSASDEDASADDDPDNEGITFKRKRTSKAKGGKRSTKTRRSDPDDLFDTDDAAGQPAPVAQALPQKSLDELWDEFNNDEASEANSGRHADDKDATQRSDKKMVTITQEFDFAGETVKVTKEVTAKEAANHPINSSSSSSSSGVGAATQGSTTTGVRRSCGGLSNLVAGLGQKKKIGTLHKSALDWQNYKSREGIEDELKNAASNRDGYLERQAFLQRADLKQFEQEKSVRDRIRRLNPK